MQNRCNQGCGWQDGFVPVNSNWDFNMERETCPQGRSCPVKAQPVTVEEAHHCPCVENVSAAVNQRQQMSFPAMVSVEMQPLGDMFTAERALKAGTLFTALHKPMAGYCPCDVPCGNSQQANAFAAWELRLYLCTHPHDQEAMTLLRQMCRDHACAEGLCASNATPWPWEYEANSAC